MKFRQTLVRWKPSRVMYHLGPEGSTLCTRHSWTDQARVNPGPGSTRKMEAVKEGRRDPDPDPGTTP